MMMFVMCSTVDACPICGCFVLRVMVAEYGVGSREAVGDVCGLFTSGLRSDDRGVRDHSQTKADIEFSCEFSVPDGSETCSEYPRAILKLSFGTTKMAAYANTCFVCSFVTKIKKRNLYWTDPCIVHSVP